jgi:hypothetical protein
LFRPLKRLLSRAPAQITIWLLLVIVSFGPQHSLRVCTMGCCTAAAALAPATQAAESCPCCQHEHAKETPGERGGGRNRAACRDCCIDLAVLTKVGPLPKPVSLPDVPMPCIAVAPAVTQDEDERVLHSSPVHCTGPPRADGRTALIATTNLRR